MAEWALLAGFEDIQPFREEADNGVIRIILNRPDRRNAMSSAMVGSLLRLIDSRAGQSAGAILLEGTGKGFCAGSDLGELAAMDNHDRGRFEADCGRLARMMMAHPRPIVAAVHGFAMGGGLTLAAACDIVVGTTEARWALPEVPIGLFPAWGLEGVSRRIGMTRARRLSWGIDRLDGPSAAQWGLVDMLAEDPAMTALEQAQRLAALPPSQVAMVKRYFAIDRTGQEADAAANSLFLTACADDAAKAGFAGRLSSR
jgi:enoyl-CoA hydratase/carnithine racemase